MNDESHQAITTMRAAFEFIDDLRDRIATLTAQRDAAEKVCEAAADLWKVKVGDARIGFGPLADALTEWRRTKDQVTGEDG